MTFTKIQITHGFRELFGVVQLHSYYKDKIATDLDFEPTGETRNLLRNFHMHFKAMPFGFILYYHQFNSPRVLESLPPKTKLSFFLKARNPAFVNYSDLPFKKENEAIYFNNLANEKEELGFDLPPEVYFYFKNLSLGEKEKYLLHSSKHALVQIKGQKFFQSYGTNGQNSLKYPYSDLGILDVFGDEKYRKQVFYKRGLGVLRDTTVDNHVAREERKLSREGIMGDELRQRLEKRKAEIIAELESLPEDGAQVDLRHVPDARYRLLAGGKEILDFYKLPDENKVVTGILDIYLTREDGSAVYKPHLGQEDRAFEPEMYLINLKARETYWRYWFMNYPNSNVSPTEVFDEDGNITFTKPRETVLDVLGKKAWVAESTQPVPLTESPVEVLWVKRMKGKRPMKDFRLRVADPSMVKPYRTEDGYKIYSDVYVYL